MDTKKSVKHAMKFARAFTAGLIDETPEAHWLHQPSPGANHVLWTVGHLGVSHHWTRCQIDPSTSPRDEHWRKLFAGGSTPTDDASTYPSIADVRAYYEEQWDQLLAMLDRMNDNELEGATPEEASYLAKTKLGLFHFVSWHEGVHVGEIAAVRKALKLEKKFA